MKRIYIILYYIFALLSLNANELMKGLITGNDNDINFEDFKLQENSAYWELRNKKNENGNENTYVIVSADKNVFNLMYIFGTAIGEVLSNTDKTEEKKYNNFIFKDINGLIIACSDKKRSKITLLFKKELFKKNVNNIKNIIISYSFDKEKPIINSLNNQWIIEGDSLLCLKENETSNFLKKALSSRVLKVKIYDNQKINESFIISLRNFQDLYDMYGHNFN
ncbi:hypothetical protein QIA17_04875 (plasmid) [Borreliella californiensis]|uniref:Uncharacterized protein n=1 Tax=Borreliella californiensis TaxID=373543 RepID=A0A7W9ZMU3_9SPIR|nr:hypothetical protein [Borreliella californiensis]MBB6213778.1 hypothetical protein [Borreliella californiensis]